MTSSSFPWTIGCLLFASTLGPLAACGGDVVAEPGSSEGAGANGGQSSNTAASVANSGAGATGPTGTTVSVGPSGTTGPGPGAGGSSMVDCAPLEKTFTEAFAQAVKCNPCIDFDGCMNGPVITDICGCPAGANSGDPSAVQAATSAYANWTSAGCGPYACDKPCVSPGGAWTCTPSGMGCVGTCQPAVF